MDGCLRPSAAEQQAGGRVGSARGVVPAAGPGDTPAVVLVGPLAVLGRAAGFAVDQAPGFAVDPAGLAVDPVAGREHCAVAVRLLVDPPVGAVAGVHLAAAHSVDVVQPGGHQAGRRRGETEKTLTNSRGRTVSRGAAEQ